MSSPILRAALEALRRDNEDPAPMLSADAERAIRRRVGTRTGLRGGAFLAIGGLAVATAAGAWGARPDDAAPSPSPTVTPDAGVASVTFPLEGGPEFEPLNRSIRCGDPAPAPNALDHDISLSLTSDEEVSGTGQGTSSSGTFYVTTFPEVPQSMTTISYEGAGDGGVAASTGVTLLAVRDGVVVGMQSDYLDLGWRLDQSSSLTGVQLLGTEWFQCPKAPDWGRRSPGTLEPGTYDVIAVARVFSTPESVALSRVIMYQDSYGMDGAYLDANPDEILLPGSYDCMVHTVAGMESVPRGCLPEVTDRASVDAQAGTVTVLYDPADLVDEFAVLLVSEPVTVELAEVDWAGQNQGPDTEQPQPLDSLDKLVCGAAGSTVWVANSKGVSVETITDDPAALTTEAASDLAGSIYATGVPDGTRVTLLPGARVVYVRWDTIETALDGGTSYTSLETVVGVAPVAASGTVTTDRYAGPQPVTFTLEPATACDGTGDLSFGGDIYAVIAGQWRIETPQGRDFTIDATPNFAQVSYFG